MKTTQKALVAVALLAISAVASADGVTLKRVVKEGDTWKYKTEGDFEVMGMQAKLTTSSVERVIKVDADGTYTIQSSSTEGKIELNGQEMPAQRPTSYSVYKASGELVEMRGDAVDDKSYRMSNLSRFSDPGKEVKVGDTWSASIKADAKTGAVAVKADYKYIADEKVGALDVAKVEVTFKETEIADGATVTATYWINKTDGGLVKYIAKWANVSVPGAPTPVSGTMTQTRID